MRPLHIVFVRSRTDAETRWPGASYRGTDSWSDLGAAFGSGWGGEASGGSSSGGSKPVQAPRLSHWSKYGTAGSVEPVRGDPSARGRRRNREWSAADREPQTSDSIRADEPAAAPADVTGDSRA